MVPGLFGREFVPLLARNLATAAGRTFGQIDEE
jgi:hypothetical protein